ncbi:hypothetical protein MARPU_00055 [Marichromatium purpuratum 984]|uniref:DUF4340 domain-containing protein n=1 Tax=Marichromatium purpuratum 984 TaxID=765910 RepID=W0E3J9_MARPU|nr:hypothetical protein [Marichromatium purpuratum]AHF05322.1 hypothetical protein MARPU_00055 [Marichromatium purpuratum 984]
MNQRWRINLVLALVLLGLALAIRDELRQHHASPLLATIEPAQIQRVGLERDGEPPLEFMRAGTGWELRTPFRAPADTEHIERLLGVLAIPVRQSFPASGLELAPLGLSPPRVRLRVDAREFAFGATDPLQQHRYVAVGDLVHLIDDRAYHLLIAPLRDYVSARPLPADFVPVQGTLEGVGLTPESLDALPALSAERVEHDPEPPRGTALSLRAEDGRMLRFRLSEDQRSWRRLDQPLRYLLATTPRLATDPALAPLPEPTTSSAATGTDPFAPESRAMNEPVLPSDTLLGPPPEVRLGPERPSPEAGFGAEPYKRPPQGFGQDPFAPDPP